MPLARRRRQEGWMSEEWAESDWFLRSGERVGGGGGIPCANERRAWRDGQGERDSVGPSGSVEFVRHGLIEVELRDRLRLFSSPSSLRGLLYLFGYACPGVFHSVFHAPTGVCRRRGFTVSPRPGQEGSSRKQRRPSEWVKRTLQDRSPAAIIPRTWRSPPVGARHGPRADGVSTSSRFARCQNEDRHRRNLLRCLPY